MHKMAENNDDEEKTDETLDPIRPSVASTMCEHMSFLYGRDPSILAYAQRPGPSVEHKKNLLPSFNSEESVRESSPTLNTSSVQTIKVYLRLKPFPKKSKLNEQQLMAYSVPDATTLIIKIPMQDVLSNSMIRPSSVDVACRRYTFTETFGPDTTQREFFSRIVESQMQEFIAGSNATIMTYGTTNSGKTFTLHGIPSLPGIIPRSLELLFSKINPNLRPSYKPIYNNTVTSLNLLERSQEIDGKLKLLSVGPPDKNQYINTYKEMQKILKAECERQEVDANNKQQYGVWVSFAEIYNETIYDLLSNDIQRNRTPLKLATDQNGVAYIKGLKSIYVTSGFEAFQVLMSGQYNLKFAATALNARSSRSHCIFTIKLLKYHQENQPESVEVSTFSFCDLAGSERLKKTLNVGDRIKEAQNINTSLLVLGRCLKSIHEGQTLKQRYEHIGPFRESKLTRLFQQPLSGKESISLIVNINPLPTLYAETQNVLNFAAIARQIVLQPKKPKRVKKSRTRFSIVATQATKSVIDWDNQTEFDHIIEESQIDECNDDNEIQMEDYEELLSENEQLRSENKELKASALMRELEIRDEMAKLNRKMIENMKQEYENQLEDAQESEQNLRDWELQKIESYYQDKIKQLSRKRKRSYCDDGDDDLYVDNESLIEELHVENEKLKNKLSIYKERLKDANKAKEMAICTKNEFMYELNIVKEKLKAAENLKKSMERDLTSDCDNDNATNYVEELKSQLNNEITKNIKLKDRLNEAVQDFQTMENESAARDHMIDKLKEERIDKTEEIADLIDEIECLNSMINVHLSSLTTLQEKYDAKSQKLAESEERNTVLVQMSDELRKEMDDQIKELSDCRISINKLQDNLFDVENENIQLKDKLTQNTEEIESLQDSEIQLKNKIKELQNKLDALAESNIVIKAEPKDLCNSSMQTSLNSSIIASNINESTQTSFCQVVEDKIIQTSLDETIYNSINKVSSCEKIKNSYDELNEEYTKAQITIDELNNQLNDFNTIKKEKFELSEKLNSNAEAMKSLENEINEYKDRVNELTVSLQNSVEEKLKKLSDKDEEIAHLQKEVKKFIKPNISEEDVKRAELQLKNTLRELSDKTDELNIMQELNKNLQTKVLNLETQIALSNAEINDMKTLNKEKERDLEEFSKNRNKILEVYEATLEKKKNELSAAESQVALLQDKLIILQQKQNDEFRAPSSGKTHSKVTRENKPPRDIKEETSDEEVISERRGRRNRRILEPPASPNMSEATRVETSGSESKRTRSTRKNTNHEVSDENKKRHLRGRKLYDKIDDFAVDIESINEFNEPQPSPASTSTRWLRTRSKK